VLNSTGGELSRFGFYAKDPNTLRLDYDNAIALWKLDKGYVYVLNATSSEDSAIRCTMLEYDKQGGEPLFDFSNATYVSTNFYYGTAQDYWTGVLVKSVVHGVVKAEAYVDSFTSALYFVRYLALFLRLRLQPSSSGQPLLSAQLSQVDLPSQQHLRPRRLRFLLRHKKKEFFYN